MCHCLQITVCLLHFVLIFPATIADPLQLAMLMFTVYTPPPPPQYTPQPHPHPHPERPFTIESPRVFAEDCYSSRLHVDQWTAFYFLHKHNKVLYRKYILTLKITWFTQNQILFLLLKYRVCTCLRLNITDLNGRFNTLYLIQLLDQGHNDIHQKVLSE